MRRFTLILLGLSLFAVTAVSAQQIPSVQKKETQKEPMTAHARGTFEVKMKALPAAPPEGLMRMSIDKEIHGDIEGTTKGEMISAGNPGAGEAGYVAMEVVTGTLAGKTGSFVLQHSATMDKSGQWMHIIVAPGSGTDQLQGIAGDFKIVIADGKHSYEFDYTLP